MNVIKNKNIQTDIYFNNFIIKKNIFESLKKMPNCEIKQWDNKFNQYTLTDLVYPETKNISRLNNSNNFNIWENLKLRPFKICPIDYKKLLLVSNNSILNICAFEIESNNLVGFIVISHKDSYFWIDILCTNINKGIGTYIINLIKFILKPYDKPIKLSSSFGAEKFYSNREFTKLSGNIFEFRPYLYSINKFASELLSDEHLSTNK